MYFVYKIGCCDSIKFGQKDLLVSSSFSMLYLGVPKYFNNILTCFLVISMLFVKCIKLSVSSSAAIEIAEMFQEGRLRAKGDQELKI